MMFAICSTASRCVNLLDFLGKELPITAERHYGVRLAQYGRARSRHCYTIPQAAICIVRSLRKGRSKVCFSNVDAATAIIERADNQVIVIMIMANAEAQAAIAQL